MYLQWGKLAFYLLRLRHVKSPFNVFVSLIKTKGNWKLCYKTETGDTHFQWIIFLSPFSIKSTPSRTFVISYILLFCTCNIKKTKYVKELHNQMAKSWNHEIKLGIWRECKLVNQTSNVSAALFKSRVPFSAPWSRLMNFFVSRPGNKVTINKKTRYHHHFRGGM